MVQKYRKKIQYKRRQQHSHTSRETMVREGKKNHKKIHKTLVYIRNWWKWYGKNAYPRHRMGNRLRCINTGNVEIWFRVYWTIRNRKDDKLHYKIYVQERRKTPNLIGKVLCSAGIGSQYIKRADAKNNKYKGEDTKETYRCKNGAKINLPMAMVNVPQ